MKSSDITEEICEGAAIHPEIISIVRDTMIEDQNIFDMAEIFKVLGDETRIRILAAISVSEMCVCDIAALLTMSNSAISHQLRVLKQAHIVMSRRAGKAVIYRMADAHIDALMQIALEHSSEE